jgi:hypothetical protein
VANVAKHYSKEEWEGNYSENSWVHFLKHWYSIGINDFLEGESEFVLFDVSGRLDSVILKPLKVSRGELSQLELNLLLLGGGTPEVADVSSFSLSHKIHRLIDRFLFRNKPLVNL